MTGEYDVWVQDLLAWSKANQDYAALLVFALGFAESIVLLAILVPSSILFAGIGAVHAASGGSLEVLWLAGALGATMGDLSSFALGRVFREDIAKFWPFVRYPALMSRGRRVFDQWGWFALTVSKFTYGVRPFVPIAAGVVRMPLRRFAAASALSALLWAGVAIGFGYGLAVVVGRLW